MKCLIYTSLIIISGNKLSSSAFVLHPGGVLSYPSSRPRNRQEFIQSNPYRTLATAAATPNQGRDVSVRLFRDFLDKIKNKEKDSDGNVNEKLSQEKADISKNKLSEENVFGSEEIPKPTETNFSDNKSDLPFLTASIPETKIVPAEELSSPESPLTKAEKLRAQASRIRLEAEKRQIELNLEKISKLNNKIDNLKKQENVNAKDLKSLEEELGRLKAQLVVDEKGEFQSFTAISGSVSSKTSASDETAINSKMSSLTLLPLSAAEISERARKLEESPLQLRALVAQLAGVEIDVNSAESIDQLNSTELVKKIFMDERNVRDTSLGENRTIPCFSDEEIESLSNMVSSKSKKELAMVYGDKSEIEIARELLEHAYRQSKSMDETGFTEEQINGKLKELETVPKFFKDLIQSQGLNDTELAIMLLEEDKREKREQKRRNEQGSFNLFGGREEKGEIGRDGERLDLDDSGTFSRLLGKDPLNGTSYLNAQSDLSLMVESLYPKTTRKEDETPDLKQVNAFMNDIVAPTNSFIPSGNPISVPGGFIIRGSNKCGSGEELINKLDKGLSNDKRLRTQISFFLLKDPFPNPEEQMLDPLNWPQVLFVTGSDVGRDPAPISRSILSAFGVATAWYGSIYPFLANSKLLDKATEAMELADAGMPVDLSWLSSMAIPLFLSFLALQVTHDFAHRAVASTKDFKVTIPTLVPSLVSGITTSITSLKSSPKNKQDLLDFAIAGPLAGMLCSILVLSYGLVLTANADAASYQNFPGLPLAILRQSSLGGGLIDLFLGDGVLNVPTSIEGAQALLSTMIPLHPLAVAGFFSLLVNALSMIPVGRTDGGRVSMALFGRSGSQIITLLSLSIMFVVGLSQSDLLLFYFAFVVFFQNELEIPMRNEVDDVDFSRVLLASFTGFLMLLTLIPV